MRFSTTLIRDSTPAYPPPVTDLGQRPTSNRVTLFLSDELGSVMMRGSSQNREMPIFSWRCSIWLPDGVWGDFSGSETVQCITILGDARKCPLPFPIHAGFNRVDSPLAGKPNKLETFAVLYTDTYILPGSPLAGKPNKLETPA